MRALFDCLIAFLVDDVGIDLFIVRCGYVGASAGSASLPPTRCGGNKRRPAAVACGARLDVRAVLCCAVLGPPACLSGRLAGGEGRLLGEGGGGHGAGLVGLGPGKLGLLGQLPAATHAVQHGRHKVVPAAREA